MLTNHLLKLVEALLECPSLKDQHSLSALLNQLPKNMSNAIPHGSTNRDQVIKIVETCSKYPNGLTELVATIRVFEGETIPLQQVEELIDNLGLSSYQTKDKSNLSPKKANKGSLLPYLINRDKQTTKLISAIKTIRKCPDNTGPLLCFIHSNENQCSDTFLTRLEKELIPDFTLSKEGVASYHINCNIDNLNDLHESIRISLAEALLSDRYAEVKVTEIIRKVATYPFPVILHTHMYTEHWLDCEKEKLLESFIRFWSDWNCSLAPNQLLLICVFFHYQDNVKNSWFHRLFKRTSVNQTIRETFENLAKEDFLAKFSVPGVVLPELQDIRSLDVEEWARKYLPDCRHPELLRELRQIFAEKDKLPMEPVVKEVEFLREKYCNDRNKP